MLSTAVITATAPVTRARRRERPWTGAGMEIRNAGRSSGAVVAAVRSTSATACAVGRLAGSSAVLAS